MSAQLFLSEAHRHDLPGIKISCTRAANAAVASASLAAALARTPQRSAANTALLTDAGCQSATARSLTVLQARHTHRLSSCCRQGGRGDKS
jgi:hypothetical protein